jgi:hypothetical protein
MSSKDYVICDYIQGLELTKLASVNSRGLFSGSILDVEQLRESLVESAQYGGTINGFYQLDRLAQSLDWKARGLPANTTTVEALDSYVDDRADRRVERWLPLSGRDPLVGDKQSDMKFADSLSSILPWIVDRASKESSWWKNHQSGRSEGRFKEPFRFDKFYLAGWFIMHSDLNIYYPPLNVLKEGHPFTLDEVVGEGFTAHEAAYFKPALPEYNPNREALFSSPYPDDAQLGKSLISAIAPVYYTGNFSGFTYNDTFMGVVGMDIAVDSISSFLDALEGTIAPSSFSMLVDGNFNTIVISRNTTARIYPERTGMEPERVTYAPDGNIIQDRRNATYLPSDTIIQSLTKLPSANWVSLLDTIHKEPRGASGYTTLNITFTGETQPREFHVWFDGWKYVAKWYLLVFAPKDEIQTAIQVKAGPRILDVTNGDSMPQVIALQALKGYNIKGYSTTGQGIIVNNGRVDLYLSPNSIPEWVTLMDTTVTSNNNNGGGTDQWPYLLRAGQSLPIDFQVETKSLPVGTNMASLVFDIRDADYPDCTHNSDVALALSVQVNAQNCTDSTKEFNDDGVCVCPAGTVGITDSCVDITALTCSIAFPLFALIIVGVYCRGLKKRKKADAVWEVKPSDLKIGTNPVVLGEGSFGLVVLADYAGTQVAVKRVLPLKKSINKGSSRASSRTLTTGFKRMGPGKLHDSTVIGSGMVVQAKNVLKEESNAPKDVDEEIQDEVNAVEACSLDGEQEDDSSWFRNSSIQDKLPALRSGVQEQSAPLLGTMLSSFTRTIGLKSRPSDYKLRREFKREMRFVAKLRHPCIITGEIFLGIWLLNNAKDLALVLFIPHFFPLTLTRFVQSWELLSTQGRILCSLWNTWKMVSQIHSVHINAIALFKLKPNNVRYRVSV